MYLVCFLSDQFPLNATPKLEGLSNFALEAIRKQNIDDLQIGKVKFYYYFYHTLQIFDIYIKTVTTYSLSSSVIQTAISHQVTLCTLLHAIWTVTGIPKKSGNNSNTKAPDNDTPPSPDFKTPGLKRSKKCLRPDAKSTNKTDESSVPKRPKMRMYKLVMLQSEK